MGSRLRGETDLGRPRPGMRASVSVDSFPGRAFTGWIGFVSSVAEFTPKTIQTEDLRTSLVYEVRVFVKDPADELRLGMPATVHIPLRMVGQVSPRREPLRARDHDDSRCQRSGSCRPRNPAQLPAQQKRISSCA